MGCHHGCKTALLLAEEAFQIAQKHGYADYVDAISDMIDDINTQIDALS